MGERVSVADEVFDRLDADGDGMLVADDYRTNAERLLQSYGMGPSAPKGRALIEASLALWERQAEQVDRDHDGRIGREEYREWFASLTASASPEVLAVLHAQFNVADRDGDGLMERHEYAVWRSLRSVQTEAAEAAFDLADTDGDGVITWDDFTAAARNHGLAALLFGP
ncbi:hypothetical protein DEJ50_01110 [Streptomyces venezuelae]|uniref:EF-hand domain-containing protein n=1 Tax=Streptomyces venezuelae TaxID=54571 RepID=A0A5P2CUR1_STRVZ|nr:EF-hand domain-containing protein [Streptomyces venezuelae]QES46656.1 hypothetical protein DEJ50_01110 [Streptomyces venezuelae]